MTILAQAPLDPITSLHTYGPYGFGALLLLVIWIVIVKPEREANRLQLEEMRKNSEAQLKEFALIAATQKEVAATQQATVLLLNQIVSRIEHTADRLGLGGIPARGEHS